ncbi:MAG: molybdopterin molybdotransferase MoeA [Bacteroidota bacterium]|nr:molybdopterin molybdotransferase MoeA [Bacteroidota bacterium]
MITLEHAIEIAFSKSILLETENVDFMQSADRILAEEVFADADMPPFNKSAMDGYACRRADLGTELSVLEIIPAGKAPTKAIGAGQCSKIMTGAQVPEGADTVFMVEYSEEISPEKIRFNGTKTNSNICLKGEDLKKGDLVLSSGTLLKSQHIAMLASVGCVTPLVYKNPVVGIISTGSELVNPEEIPGLSQIRNSNGPQLLAQAKTSGFPVNYYGIVPDDEQLTKQIIQKSVNESNVTILSGGVSVGDFDFVPKIIQELGFEIHFSKISIKPGQHTTFASKGNKYIIGLPGNPVSSFIQFEVFAKPFLRKLMNYQQPEYRLPMHMSHDFNRKKTDREECLPVQINDKNEVQMVAYHGSAHIHAYHQAFGYISIPAGKTEIKKGEIVDVRPL